MNKIPKQSASFVARIALLGLFMVVQVGADSSEFLAVFEAQCITCHGKDGKVKGKVNLVEIEEIGDLAKDPELLADLIDALDFQDMPPEDEPPLDESTRVRMVQEFRSMLSAAVRTKKMYPQTPIRRMNRFQYSNAVRDLLQLKVDVFTLPENMLRDYGYFKPQTRKMPESLKAGSRPLGKSQLISPRLAGVAPFPQDLRAEHGYDNQGDHLSLSPLLLESFLKLSQSIFDSRDFNQKTCGIWASFFAPPPAPEKPEELIPVRLRGFLTRAFRRPAGDDLVERYAAHALDLIQSGASFTDAMKAVASAAIASPRFLYLYERAEGKGHEAVPIDDFERASRLSFFLWGSIPDQALLDAAAAGRLSNVAVYTEQIERMLNDPKLKRFCDSFPAQWLQLDRIISAAPDKERFPEFYFSKYRASMHMMLEPLLLFETILIENRSILELVDSDYSYRSALLTAWYDPKAKVNGGPPTAIPFKRVAISDRRQGGVITTAAVMTMTSNATRSQPITRGAWMAGVIFNDPPEPPPADVPPLDETHTDETKNMTLRERLDAHRERPNCSGCHEQIDPLGFALENYGATGFWRDEYENGREVDMQGTLFRKHPFNSIEAFKDAILAEKDRFTRGFAAHVLSFALGRELSAADSLALDHLTTETIAAEYTLRDLIKQVALSEPFLYKCFNNTNH